MTFISGPHSLDLVNITTYEHGDEEGDIFCNDVDTEDNGTQLVPVSVTKHSQRVNNKMLQLAKTKKLEA